MDPALRALNHFGMGARIGERRGVAGDARGWLRAQLEGKAPLLNARELPAAAQIGEAIRGLRGLAASEQERRREARQRLLAIGAAEARAALGERITSERPFVERLVAFWSNHLCISASAKLLGAPLAGSYEREVIRPHVLGRFEDMLRASAHHPAMLIYLDNFQSLGPGSPAARRGRRGGAQRGLNENYARELLELHTLGVDGGYAQQDVQELAKILTGWTVAGFGGRRGLLGSAADSGAVRFAFVAQMHEPGAKTVLGREYRAAGADEGDAVLRDLARHPSTASFLARKLVQHFVADTPPADAVESIAQVFRESDGDLRAVADALIDLPHAWRADTRKFRTPHDWLVAVLRAFDAKEAHDALPPLLRQLRQPLWSPQAPKGYGDTMQEWADPDALLNRAELARSIARRLDARAPDPRALLDVVTVASGDPLPALLADRSISAGERLALALASPAFQWR